VELEPNYDVIAAAVIHLSFDPIKMRLVFYLILLVVVYLND